MIDSIPLIQNPNDAQQINASIIAMKKASKELDEKILKLNNLNSELDKKIAFLDSGLNKEIEDRKEAINSLDVPSVGGSGKYISAISETDGKISATASDITSTVSSGNSQPVTSGGVAEAIAPLQPIDSVTNGNLHPVTSSAVYNSLRPFKNWQKWNVDGTRYILLYDITAWWNAPTSAPVATKSIIGTFHLVRYGGWTTTDLFEVAVQVGFYKFSSTDFHNNVGCRIFARSLTGALKIALIKYNNKYYIALKNIVSTWAMEFNFWGIRSDGILGTDVPDGSTVEEIYITP